MAKPPMRTASVPSDQDPVSWAGPDQPAPPTLGRWQAVLTRISWGTLVIAVLIALAFDLSALVIAVLIDYSKQCPSTGCSLTTQLHQARHGLLFVPLILLVPAVVVLLLRRARLVVILAQALVCLFVLSHDISSIHHLENVLNGKTSCRISERTAPDCPKQPG